MTNDMNRTELTLLLALGSAVVQHAGRITTEAGYAGVTDEQRRTIALRIEDVLTDTIVGMRSEGPAPTLDELAQVMQEIAASVVVSVLGDPQAPTVLH